MGKAKDTAWSADESFRCGRCATLLPDETLNYCPACGVVFSQVPPTSSYSTLQSHQIALARRRRWLHFSISSTLILLIGIFMIGLSWQLHRQSLFEELRVYRQVNIYMEQDPAHKNYQELDVLEALPVAIQSFSDHFNIQLPQWHLNRTSLPATGVSPSGVTI